jgi:hypothetical protein
VDLKLIQRLCADDREALDLIDKATKGKQGERTDLFDNIQDVAAPTGTSCASALRRLRKDSPKLHAEVLARKTLATRFANLRSSYSTTTFNSTSKRGDALTASPFIA